MIIEIIYISREILKLKKFLIKYNIILIVSLKKLIDNICNYSKWLELDNFIKVDILNVKRISVLLDTIKNNNR